MNKGMFKPLVMFFGLTNSPAMFQSMMNELFKDLIDTGLMFIYMDDILIATKTLEQHRELVKQVLQCLQDNSLFLKPKKCDFEKEQMDYLGLILKPRHHRYGPYKTPRNCRLANPSKPLRCLSLPWVFRVLSSIHLKLL